MEYRHYKDSGAEISLLGFGCMRLPTVEGSDSEIAYDEAKKMIDMAYAGGVNYFDTAWFYHNGGSETFVGKALKDYDRTTYNLATKLPMAMIESVEQALSIFEKQLENCQTDYFDFYLFHAMDADKFATLKKLGLYEIFDKFRQQGKIRRLGFSFHDSVPVLAEICEAYQWDFAQLQMNYLDWEHLNGKEMYAILEGHGIPMVVMEPVRGGRLADLGPEANAVLKEKQPDKSIASWALRWVGGLPNTLCTLSGMSTPEQVTDNLSTFSPLAPLSPCEQTVLDSAVSIFKKASIVPCTGCRYCMPCPSGVDIPGMMDIINQCAFDGHTFRLRGIYPEHPAESNAGNCIACGACEAACPQKLPISQLMQKLHADATASAPA